MDGRYQVVRRLGEGGQAAVLAVLDTKLGVGRALKALRPHLAANDKTRARFESEARTLALVEHEHVVRIYDVATTGQTAYLVLEHVTGGSLLDRLNRDGPMPTALAVRLVAQVCSGLATAHERGVVHRDIKPENLLVARDGTVKLADFGIARTHLGQHTIARAKMGTFGFVAPEQLADARSVDRRADVYSLGMTLYVLLTCTGPGGWSRERRHPLVPDALARVLDRATQEAAAARHPTVAELAAELEACLMMLPPSPAARLSGRSAPSEPDDPEWTPLEEIATWFEAGRSFAAPTRLPYPASELVPAARSGARVAPPRSFAPEALRHRAEHLPRFASPRVPRLPLLVLAVAIAIAWVAPVGDRAAETPEDRGPERLAAQREVALHLVASGADAEHLERLFGARDRAKDAASREHLEALIDTELRREARRILGDDPARRAAIEARLREVDSARVELVSTGEEP